MKKQVEKKDWRNNLTVYKIAFWILLFHLIVLAGFMLFASNNNEETNCNPCNYIISTPSWLVEGKLIGVGYIPNMTTEIMIENDVTFIYRDDCSWCNKQKENLNMDMLNQKGLTLKC